jgi:hypothetical protein
MLPVQSYKIRALPFFVVTGGWTDVGHMIDHPEYFRLQKETPMFCCPFIFLSLPVASMMW